MLAPGNTLQTKSLFLRSALAEPPGQTEETAARQVYHCNCWASYREGRLAILCRFAAPNLIEIVRATFPRKASLRSSPFPLVAWQAPTFSVA